MYYNEFLGHEGAVFHIPRSRAVLLPYLRMPPAAFAMAFVLLGALAVAATAASPLQSAVHVATEAGAGDLAFDLLHGTVEAISTLDFEEAAALATMSGRVSAAAVGGLNVRRQLHLLRRLVNASRAGDFSAAASLLSDLEAGYAALHATHYTPHTTRLLHPARPAPTCMPSGPERHPFLPQGVRGHLRLVPELLASADVWLGWEVGWDAAAAVAVNGAAVKEAAVKEGNVLDEEDVEAVEVEAVEVEAVEAEAVDDEVAALEAENARLTKELAATVRRDT